jgi:hypothetical protein
VELVGKQNDAIFAIHFIGLQKMASFCLLQFKELKLRPAAASGKLRPAAASGNHDLQAIKSLSPES